MDIDCASCGDCECCEGTDCYDAADDIRRLYEEAGEAATDLSRVAAGVEAEGYMRWPRALEIIRFAERAGYEHLGVAFCVGLAAEAEIVAEVLAREFEVVSVCCKLCGIDKKSFGLEQIVPEKDPEVMCNPAGQATLLNEAGTQLNVLCGLCVGHDAIFNMISRAPVTTLIVKDRVLAHNPVGAVYSQYIRRTMLPETN